jgi:nitrogen fixation NifU-like protein
VASLYSKVILDHFRNPRNFGSLEAPDAEHEDVNPLCGDRIRIELRIRDGLISDFRFRGDGCAICIAAASVLSEMVTGVSTEEGLSLAPDELLDSLQSEIKASRLKCALLPLEVLKAALSPA